MKDTTPYAVSIVEAARMMGISRTSVYAAIRNGHLKIRKAGRRTLIETSELRSFIARLPGSKRTL